MEGRKKRSESERRSRGSERGGAAARLVTTLPLVSVMPPVFELPDIKRNKDLCRLKADLEERARARLDQKKSRSGVKVEVLYVDTTRNVGVALGEKNVAADMKKPGTR